MITRHARALLCALALILPIALVPAVALAQASTYPLLSSATPAPAAAPLAGDYAVILPANFNGATITVTVLTSGQVAQTLTYTAQPTTTPIVNIPAGSLVTASVGGGVPSGATTLNAAGSSGVVTAAGLSQINTSLAGLLSTSDTGGVSNNAPFQGAVTMTVATTYAARRSVGANCSVAGTITLTLADASSITLPVAVGWQSFPFAATAVASVSGAVCTYSNLK